MRVEPIPPESVACQQVLMDDASVFSIQWLDFPEHLAPLLAPPMLLARYLLVVRRVTFSLVRPQQSATGVEMRLAASRLSLISMTLPGGEEAAAADSIYLGICGGLLLQQERCGEGVLTFSREPLGESVRVTLQLAGYAPRLLGGPNPRRWRRALYRFTQAALHRLVTVHFLAGLYREFVDPSASLEVRRVKVREGVET